MTNTTLTQRAGLALISVMLISSCSRPVAYFQHQPVERYAVSQTQPIATGKSVRLTVEPTGLVPQTEAAAPVNAVVRNDSKPTTTKTANGRIARVQTMLEKTNGSLTPTEQYAPRRMNLVERMIVKKMNRKISHQLAPNSPQKVMISRGKLIGGVVLLVGGLLLLIFGTGTVAFIGLIVGLVGALAILVSLLGIDSY